MSLNFALQIDLPNRETKIVVGPWGHHANAIADLDLPQGSKITGLMVGEFKGFWSAGEDAPKAVPYVNRSFLSDPKGDCRPIELRPLKAAVQPGQNGQPDTLQLVDKSFEDPREILINGAEPIGKIDWVQIGTLQRATTINSYNPDGRYLFIGGETGTGIQFG